MVNCKILVTIILLCLETSAYARPEIIRTDEDAVELQAIAQSDPQEIQDFLDAEIRPSGHKALQV